MTVERFNLPEMLVKHQSLAWCQLASDRLVRTGEVCFASRESPLSVKVAEAKMAF